ncbi:hypothetical protein L486_04208 [Kwoniella mangroviensis CBS 10435]|uniref:Uncharacterized protein n=1 Tax=Kwoniella mangroviensis CBS 10435 TaxID=1331196 RepID=A0A1B9IRL5_9TREE|nr:hypothetical protein L486_04208 [Kwoniella mangroviensis CBS 10435]
MPHKRAKRSVREAETAKKGTNLAPSSKSLNSAYDDTPKSASRIISGWKFQSEFRKSGKTNSEDTGEYSKSSSLTGSGSAGVKGKAKAVDKSEIPKILPNETLGEYNRRIENLLRSGVSKAIKDAASTKALEVAQANRDKKVRKRKAKLEKLIKDGKVPKEALEKYLKEVREKEEQRNDNSNNKGKRKRDNEEEKELDEDGQGKQARPAKEFKEMEGPRRLNDIVQAPPQLPHLRKSGEKKTSTKEAYSAIGKNSDKIPLNAGQKRILEEERERVVKMYREMKAKKEEEKGKKV